MTTEATTAAEHLCSFHISAWCRLSGYGQPKAEPGTTPGPTSVWITTSIMIKEAMASYHEIHQPTRLC